MAAPSPLDPPSTTATATATTTHLFSNPLPSRRDPPRPIPQPLLSSHHPNSFQRQNHHPQHLYANQTNPRLHPQQQQPNIPQIHQDQGILYPLASSGRGFLPRPIPHHNYNHSNNLNHHHHSPADQSVAIPNSSARSNPIPYSYQVRPYGFSHSDPSNQSMHLVRPPTTHLQQSLLGSTGGTVPNIFRGVVPVSTNPKVAPPSSVSDCNGIKDIRERSSDDNYITIRDRKVKVSEDSSLYSLCRSWVKNSISEENQPQYTDCVKSLPKPLPVPDANSEVKKEDDKEENVEDVENLSPKELLQVHIKRAKKVRARLREERLQRIARYKDRLALLLPPVVEQQFKNDSVSAN